MFEAMNTQAVNFQQGNGCMCMCVYVSLWQMHIGYEQNTKYIADKVFKRILR